MEGHTPVRWQLQEDAKLLGASHSLSLVCVPAGTCIGTNTLCVCKHQLYTYIQQIGICICINLLYLYTPYICIHLFMYCLYTHRWPCCIQWRETHTSRVPHNWSTTDIWSRWDWEDHLHCQQWNSQAPQGWWWGGEWGQVRDGHHSQRKLAKQGNVLHFEWHKQLLPLPHTIHQWWVQETHLELVNIELLRMYACSSNEQR